MNTRLKREHAKKGLCTDCSLPALPESGRCYKHTESHKLKNAAYRSRLKDKGRCPGCGEMLHPDMDEGRLYCLFCRERIRDNYAVIQQTASL